MEDGCGVAATVGSDLGARGAGAAGAWEGAAGACCGVMYSETYHCQAKSPITEMMMAIQEVRSI